MTKPSPYELGYRTVATARAVILSPANVCPLPWVQVALDALLEKRKASHEHEMASVSAGV